MGGCEHIADVGQSHSFTVKSSHRRILEYNGKTQIGVTFLGAARLCLHPSKPSEVAAKQRRINLSKSTHTENLALTFTLAGAATAPAAADKTNSMAVLLSSARLNQI